MDRKKFMEELAFLLQDVDDLEREEAMQYYQDYFDEAGVENEQQVISDLGSPERVAAIIKAGLKDQFDQDIEYSEKGMDNSNYKQASEIIDAKIISEEEVESDDSKSDDGQHFRGNPDRNKILLVLIIIGALFLILPVGAGVFGVGVGIFGGILGLAFGILFGGIGCLAGAIACIVKAFMVMAGFPGAGLILLALGFVLVALTVFFFWMAKGLIKLIPAIIRGVVNVCRSLIGRVGDR